jgi:hypothetical protein
MAEHASRRTRFVAARAGLSPNTPWGVHDYLSKCWAVEPKLSKADAEARATAMDKASRGRGR